MNPIDKFVKISAVPAILSELTGVTRKRCTIYNWANKGCRTADGRIVKLGLKTRLGQLFTSRRLIEKFIREVG